MATAKLKRHLTTKHPELSSKTEQYFKRELELNEKLISTFAKKFKLSNKAQEASYAENRIRGLVTVDDTQFGFMPEKDTTHALLILRKMQEEFCGREKKLYMYFVNLEKAFDRVPRKVMEWALRKKG